MKTQYDDIIHLPHHVSKTRPQMSMLDRAAQFSPFAALTGYEDAIRKIKRFMEDEENLSKSAQKIVKTKQQAAGEGAML